MYRHVNTMSFFFAIPKVKSSGEAGQTVHNSLVEENHITFKTGDAEVNFPTSNVDVAQLH